MKKTVFSLLLVILAISCSKTELQEEEYVSLEKVKYEIADDTFITVLLDPNLELKSHSFSSLDEHDDYLSQLEDASNNTITVNKKMYNDLSHYFDPFQISIFDKNYVVAIGKDQFKVTKEGIYKKTKDSGNWELYLYYGLSGKESLKESELIHKHSENLSKLEKYEFKCPQAKNLYKEKAQKGFMKGKNVTYYNYRNADGTLKTVKYKETFDGDIFTANIRWKCWNEEYHKLFGTKAKGGTITEINRSNSGWIQMDDDTKIGRYLTTGEYDESIGYVKVKVETSRGSKTAQGYKRNISVDNVKRKKKTNAWSYHSGAIRKNDTGELTNNMIDFRIN